MIKYNNTNNASTTLTAGISASSTTLIVENGDILPTAPFLLTLEHFDNEKVTVREIVKCIAKAGNILTIQRGAGTCVQDDSATPKAQNNTPHSFSVGDCASIYWTSEQVQDIQNEIEKKLNIDDFQAGTYVYGATSTGTDAYSITIPGTLTSYAVGQVFRFMADVDNEGNATLNINGLGAVEIRKNHDKILDNGDIEAGQIVEVAYDGTYFQMDSQVATVVDITSAGNTQYATGVAGEDLEVGDVCCLVDFENDYFGMKLFGATESSVEYEVIGNGETASTIDLWLGRRGNTSGENLVVELLDGETVVGSITVPRAGLTEDTTTKQTLSWGEDITTVKGKSYTLKLRTYDNSVDADKGFYVNKSSGSNTYNLQDVYYANSKNGAVLGTFDNFYLSARSGTNGSDVSVAITSGNDIITISLKKQYIYLYINGTQVAQKYGNQVTENIYFSPGKVSFMGTEYEVENSRYVISSRSGTPAQSYRYFEIYLAPMQMTKQLVNYKTNNLYNNLFYKGNDQYLFVSSTNVDKGDVTVQEIGGESNVISGTKGENSGFYGNVLLGYFNTFGKLKYKPKYYQPLPTQNTDFYLVKDAVMVCSFSGNNNASSYTLKKGGDTYRNFSFNGNGYGVSITEYVEWELEGGHTYQIDFNPNMIKEFYLVD